MCRKKDRTRADKALAIARVEKDGPIPLLQLHGRQVHANGHRLTLTTSRLVRWILEGRIGQDGERVYLDAIKRGENWFSSEAAVGRFLRACQSSPSVNPFPPAAA